MEKSKYNVDADKSKRSYDGIVFDSIMEMKYYRDVLRPKMESGEIICYELQKAYELQPEFIHNGKKVLPITYIADFYIKYSDGREVVIDIKGCPDQKAIIKKKMFLYHYPHLQYQWLTYVKKYGGWCDYNDVKRKRRLEKLKKKSTGGNNEEK